MKCVVRDGDRVLFVRHTYGDRRSWELPGGGLRRGEEPEAAVRREIREELGLDVVDVTEVGRVEISGHHKRTLLVCFEGRTGGAPLHFAAAELAEARWAPASDPPRPLGEDVPKVLRLLGGEA